MADEGRTLPTELAEASRMLAAQADMRRGRLVTRISIGVWLLTWLAFLMAILFLDAPLAFWDDPILVLVLVVGLGALAAAALAREGATMSGAVLLVNVFALGVLGATLLAQDPLAALTTLFAFTVVPVLAGFSLSSRATVVYTLVAVAITVLFGLSTGATSVITLVILLLIIGASMTVHAYEREHDEEVIEAQASKLLEHAAGLESIIESSPEGMVSLDADLRLRSCNRTAVMFARRLWGWQPQAGEPVLEILPADRRADVRKVLEAALAGHRFEQTVPLQDALGSGHYEVVVSPLTRDGEVTGVGITVRDVTVRQREIDRETQDRMGSLQASLLHEMHAYRERMLGSTAHEIKSPLTELRVQFDLLRRKGDGSWSESQLTTLQSMDRTLGHLERLTRSLMDVARLHSEEARVRLEPVDLVALLQDLATMFTPMMENRGIRLVLDMKDDSWVRGDPGRLQQVFESLLRNAMSRSPKHVVLETDQEGDEAVVRVLHDGESLDQDEQATLFEPFAGTMQQRGSVELYVAKGLAEAHGGTIETAPSDEGGAFIVRFPVSD